MFRSYIKLACRNALRQPGYSIINIVGLAISMAVVIPILLWIFQQMSYNRFNTNLDRIVILAMEKSSDSGSNIVPTQPAPMAPRLKDNIPEIETYVRTIHAEGSLTYNDKSFNASITFTDPSLLTVFTFPLKRGDSASALADPHSVVLSIEMAKKIFGDADPMGKTLDLNKKINLTVSGILHDIPSSSSIQSDVLVPLQQVTTYGKKDVGEWGGSDYTTWLLLKPGFNIEAVQSKVDTFCSDVYSDLGWYKEQRIRFFLTSLGNLHLYGPAGIDGILNTIMLLGVIALGMLLVACLNYSNLAAARVAMRSQEIEVRKIIGATRKQLLIQLFMETAVINVVSLLLAIGIVELALPIFSNLLNINLEFRLVQPSVLGILLAVTMLMNVLSSLYPILVSFKMKPIIGVSRKFLISNSGMYLRWSGIVFQVALSGVLLFCSSGIRKQMDYILEKDLGLDIRNVIQIKATPVIKEHFQTLREELLQNPEIHSVSASELSICNIGTVIGSSWNFEGRDKSKILEVHLNKVTADYANTFGIKIREGRFFSPEYPSDKENAVVLSRTAVDLMGMEDPVGRRFSFWGYEMKVIGVMEDFHLEPLSETIKPLVLINRTRPNYIYVKIAAQNVRGTLAKIQSTLRNIDPTSEPSYGFLGDQYSQMYSEVRQAEDFMGLSSFLATVIACVGIFGLVSIIAEKKRREIGIRKVLGASVIRVSGNVILEFAILATLGALLSIPVSVLLVHGWLENFAYHSGISIGIYFQTIGILVLMVSIGAIYPALNAATSNPVDALRSQ